MRKTSQASTVSKPCSVLIPITDHQTCQQITEAKAHKSHKTAPADMTPVTFVSQGLYPTQEPVLRTIMYTHVSDGCGIMTKRKAEPPTPLQNVDCFCYLAY